MRIAKHLCWLVLLVSAAVVRGQSPAAPAPASDVSVVVSAANPISDLSLSDLRGMLTGERRFWKGNVQVRLALRAPGTRERDRVITGLLQLGNAQFEAIWRAKIFRGEAVEGPRLMLSDALACQYVREYPGALSIIASRNVEPGLKVLKIEGKLPGEPGYPLK